jgi:class 3 adenylate cyclase
LDAERRQVVILFADMVGYTAFSERFGEEAAFGLIQTLTLTLDRAVQAEGARLQSHLGDGVVVAFGAPAAIEDAPLRACRAALSILASLKSSAEEIEAKHRIRPQLRIGIHAGPAVFGEIQPGGEAGTAVLGDTVNLAARLQSIAEPGTAVLSEPTLRLVEGQVDATFVGEQPIKGRSAPEKVYRLDAIRENVSRFAVTLSRGLTAFVGRDSELETLGRGLDSIGAGVRVIDIVGDPGIGKSRLLHEFLQQVVRRRAWTLTGHCPHDGRQTPYRAFIDIVRGVAGIAPGGDGPSIRGKLGEGLQALGLGAEENLDLLVNLLGYEAGPGALAELDGVLIGLRTREVLRRIVQARARLAPLILAFEDIHWLDSASEALLGSLIAIGPTLPLLIVHTRRPVYKPPWMGDASVTPIALDPLPARETLRIAQARLGVERLPEALAKLIVERAEGNALFAEEIVSFLVERGVVSRSAAGVRFDPAAVTAALPHSVQSILASRIDQLSREARGLLQMAAVVGRRFDPRLVLALTGETSRAGSSFATMEALDLIHRDEPSGDYLFKHILVRDALYGGLLSGPREAMHRKVGEELERRGGNAPFERAEALAHHFAAGKERRKGVRISGDGGAQELERLRDPGGRGLFSPGAGAVGRKAGTRRAARCGSRRRRAARNVDAEGQLPRGGGDRRQLHATRQKGGRHARAGHGLLLPDAVAGPEIRTPRRARGDGGGAPSRRAPRRRTGASLCARRPLPLPHPPRPRHVRGGGADEGRTAR